MGCVFVSGREVVDVVCVFCLLWHSHLDHSSDCDQSVYRNVMVYLYPAFHSSFVQLSLCTTWTTPWTAKLGDVTSRPLWTNVYTVFHCFYFAPPPNSEHSFSQNTNLCFVHLLPFETFVMIEDQCPACSLVHGLHTYQCVRFLMNIFLW